MDKSNVYFFKMPEVRMTQRAPVLILGMSETGLGALRLLGRSGVICYGLDTIGRPPAYWSRYCRCGVSLPAGTTDDEILHSLDELSARAPCRPVLLPTSDRFVHLVSSRRAELHPRFHLLLPEHELVEDLLYKDRFVQRALAAGAIVPRGVTLQGLEDLPSIAADLEFPLILRPARKEYNGASSLPKAIFVEREEDAAVARDRYAACAKVQFVAQEYIPGADCQHVSVAVCLDHQGGVVAAFTARKQRQGNLGAGVGSYVEMFQDPESQQIAVALLRSLGYVGVAEVEFKRHTHTGQLYVIEVNPRVWSQVTLPGACGLNFPLMFYCLAACLPLPSVRITRLRMTWQDLWDDFYNTFRGSGYHAAGKVSRWQWLKQSLGARAGPYFALSDPLPAAARLWHVVGYLLNKMGRG